MIIIFMIIIFMIKTFAFFGRKDYLCKRKQEDMFQQVKNNSCYEEK